MGQQLVSGGRAGERHARLTTRPQRRALPWEGEALVVSYEDTVTPAETQILAFLLAMLTAILKGQQQATLSPAEKAAKAMDEAQQIIVDAMLRADVFTAQLQREMDARQETATREGANLAARKQAVEDDKLATEQRVAREHEQARTNTATKKHRGGY